MTDLLELGRALGPWCGLLVGVLGLGSFGRLRANLSLADDRADRLERDLDAERADRRESEDRCAGELARLERERDLDRRACEREISRLEGTIAGLTTDTGKLIAEAVVHAMGLEHGSPSTGSRSGTMER